MADQKIAPNRKPRNDLTAEFVRSLLHYDPETGVFLWRFRPTAIRGWNTKYAGTIAGTVRDEYRRISIGKKIYLAHRLAWLYVTGAWPKHQIDHRDLNRKNNRFKNLREASHGDNVNNMGLRRNNTSGFKGVHWHEGAGRWRARIDIGSQHIHLGYFGNKKAAAAAYKKASLELHGEFHRTR